MFPHHKASHKQIVQLFCVYGYGFQWTLLTDYVFKSDITILQTSTSFHPPLGGGGGIEFTHCLSGQVVRGHQKVSLTWEIHTLGYIGDNHTNTFIHTHWRYITYYVLQCRKTQIKQKILSFNVTNLLQNHYSNYSNSKHIFIYT